MPKVRVGTAPVNWNNPDVPDYRPATPYDEMLDQMAAAGYQGTEIGAEFPADPEQVKADLGSRDLAPASTFCSVNLRDTEQQAKEVGRAEEQAKYLAAIGVDTLIIADSGDEHRRRVAGRVGAADMLDDADWENMSDGLREIARRIAGHNVHIAFHNHVGTYVETEEELDHLLSMTDPLAVGLCLDVGHLVYGGGNVMRVVDRHGDRIRYIHLKDVNPAVLERSRREGLGFHDALRLGIFTEFGTGGMDFHLLFSALDSLDYTGWIIVEQDTTRTTPLQSARINREYLRREFGL
ncbi:MAG TPA: sugar phosphate isomerase/epimerase [Chloroflexota bacterium]|nr:sugar phosphate isomerase/epimerase [Chloroflexota bacterium]